MVIQIKITFLRKTESFEMFENKSLFNLVQIEGCYGVIRIEEKTLVCAISRKLIFG